MPTTQKKSAPVTKSSPDYVKVRQAAKTTGLAKKAFQAGSGSLTKYQITSDLRLVFKMSGIDFPSGVYVGLDTAQIILAGGVLVDGIQMGAKIGQVANASALVISATASLLADLGILNSQVADFAALGVNATLAITSGGANILADIGAVLALIKVVGDLKTDFGGSKTKAIQIARKELIRSVHEIFDPEAAYAASQVKLYTAKKLNPFDMIGNIALNSPDLFEDFFPDIASYFPNWTDVTITVTGTSHGIFSSKTDTERFSFIRLVTTKKQVQTVLVKKYIIEPMEQYVKDQISSKCISLRALSVISMMLATATGKAVTVGFDFDVIGACAMLGLTPSILGDDWVFEGGVSHESVFTGDNFDPNSMLPYTPATLQPAGQTQNIGGLVINGKTQISDSDRKIIEYREKLKAFQFSLYSADKMGRMDVLVKNKEAMALMAPWAKITIVPTWGPESREPLGMQLKPMAIPISMMPWFNFEYAKTLDRKKTYVDVPGSTRGERWLGGGAISGDGDKYIDYVRKNYTIDISNYWKSLQTLNTMRKANLFQDDLGELAVWGDLDEITKLFESVYSFVLAKNMNQIAQNNVAGYLDIPPENLASRLDSQGNKVYYNKVGV